MAAAETPTDFMRRLDLASMIGARRDRELRGSLEADEIRKTIDSVGMACYYPTFGVSWSGKDSDDHELYVAWRWSHLPGRIEKASGRTPPDLLVSVQSLIREQGLHARSIGKAATAADFARKAAVEAVAALRVAAGLNPDRTDLVESLAIASDALDKLSAIKKEK